MDVGFPLRSFQLFDLALRNSAEFPPTEIQGQ